MANNGGTTEHVKVHYNCKDCRTFQRDVKYLEHLLDKERTRGRQQRQWRLTLCVALDEANAKLAKLQPREENCNGDEKTCQPEEGDYYDKEALSTSEILTETTKQNQETDLHRCYQELQGAHAINQQRFAVELQAERSKNETLLDEVEKLRASNNDINEKYEADKLRAKQQVTHMKAELEEAVKSQMDTFQAEQNLIRTRMMEEMRCLCKNAAEEKMLLQKEVEELTSQLSLKKEREVQAHAINQQKFAVKLHNERSKNEALLLEVEKLRASNNDINEKYEADKLLAKQQVTHMRAELEEAAKSQMDTFQAEQNLIRTQMMEEMRCLRKNAAEEKMLLQKEVEELTSQLSLKKEREVQAHAINQQKFAVKLHNERSKNEALLLEVEKLRASNNDINEKYEADKLLAKQQVTHRAELEEAVKSQMDTFQAEQNLIRTRMMEQMRCLRKNAAEEKMLLQKEVEELTSQLSLKKEREDVKHQEQQEEKEEDKQEEKEGEPQQEKQEESLSEALPAPEPVETEVSEEKPKKKCSFWKAVRRCLGLRRRRNT